MSLSSSPPRKGNASETSPLLERSSSPTEALKARGSNDSLSSHGILESASNTGTEPTDDEERQEVDERRYEGLPEVQKKLKYIIPALAIGVFLAAMDQTIIVASYGRIGTDLNALSSTSWIATAYFLTLTSFQPLYGRLSDIYGRKAALLSAYMIFGTGCLLCGLARTLPELVAARAFAGIGGGGMTTVVSILLSDVVSLRDRGAFQGYINIIYAVGAGLGGPLGGWLADSLGWRWAFLGQVPLALLATIAVSLALHLPDRADVGWKANLRRVDFLGAFVLVACVFTLLLGLDRASNVSWTDKITVTSLSTSCALVLVFVLVESKYAAAPFAPGHIIFDRTCFACFLCFFFSFGGWLATIFYIPLYYQAVDGDTAAQAGVQLLPAIVAGVTGSLFAGFWMKKTGKLYVLTVCAYTMLVLGFVPIVLFAGLVSNSAWGISAGLVVCGFSNGVGVTTSLVALIAQAAPEDQAVATACSYLFRSLGSVLGISISSTVVQRLLQAQLRESLKNGADADEIVRRVRQSLDYLKTLDPETLKIVRHAYSLATRAGFVVQGCLVAGAAVSAFWIREKKLSR